MQEPLRDLLPGPPRLAVQQVDRTRCGDSEGTAAGGVGVYGVAWAVEAHLAPPAALRARHDPAPPPALPAPRRTISGRGARIRSRLELDRGMRAGRGLHSTGSGDAHRRLTH